MGLVWVRLEHECFDFSFEGLSTSESIIAVCQQSIHYVRVMLVWPLYLAEDFLIYLDNKEIEDE
jgi:hypothetical protein